MGEGHYYNISENLKISIENLYKNNEHLLKQIEEGIKEKRKENPIVGYQGVAGSYGEEAAMTFLEESTSLFIAHEEFEDIFEALNKGAIDYGAVPIENSSAGEVLENYDLMLKHNIYIVGEQVIKIEANLLGLKGAAIEDLKEDAIQKQKLYLNAKGFLRRTSILKKNLMSIQLWQVSMFHKLMTLLKQP